MTSNSPENAAVTISIIIVNYNVRLLLENLLHSLYASLGDIPAEIFLVDNASVDGSVEMVRREFPSVILVESGENIGFARANNLALRRCRGKYILLINPDTFVQEDTIPSMIRFFEENPMVGMAGCKIINPDGTLEPACRRSFPTPWVAFSKLSGLSNLFPRSRLFARYNLTYLNEDESYEVDAISGSFMMLRREVYDAVGGLDETYFMYGEDLDWCFRVREAGWKVFYSHKTKIIHFGGESTKRSSIDSTALFYEAMRLFVKKNLKLGKPGTAVINFGIFLRSVLSRWQQATRRIWPVVVDMIIVCLSLVLAEVVRFGSLPSFPSYAYPTIYIAAVVISFSALFLAGAYTKYDYPVSRSVLGVLFSFIIISSIVFFFKDFAFSRGVVLIAALISLVGIPGWRLVRQLISTTGRSSPFSGSPTLLVGINELTSDIIKKLRTTHTGSYHLMGIIDTSMRRIGESFDDVPILGSIDNIGKIINENSIRNVIFCPGVLRYAEILSIISRTRGMPVHYRMVAQNMEYIVGKAGIDELGTLPMVDIEYNLERLSHRVGKRLFDLAFAVPGLLFVYPFAYIFGSGSHQSRMRTFILGLPDVARGRRSLVGRSEISGQPQNLYLGKPGLTGLAKLQGTTLSPEEREHLDVQYARNHTLFLDFEILVRSIISFLRTPTHEERKRNHGEDNT
ncbi:MAG: glycosyltransferase [Chlorobi bacterium]|nr:glycosyltransferase [Chlorobiota bacterium]